ncbi:GGDEF domain-containing protein [Aliivibrio sp.]|uniref:GGDEF domain-containing protein n=1 Tax=Aliivibrio sp. TaxID=1872443 RepID=UPI003D2F41F8
MKDSSDKLYILAHQDSLTGLWNRRHFFDFASNTSTKRPHSYAMLDIDLFKQVNDTYGHDAGDKVLQEVSQLINSFFPNDLVARIGGEEFVVQSIMKPTDFHTQLELLRSELADYTISINGDLIGVTISIGMTSGADKLDVMLKKADSSLYEAKRNGRNQIVCSS